VDIAYTPSYWDNYFNGSYEDTYRYGFSVEDIIEAWQQSFKELPKSFADIGCGPGQVVRDFSNHVKDAKVYGVEVQPIPRNRCVSDKIIFGDFLKIHQKLEPVDLLYVSCSMYVPWEEQEQFLHACAALAEKAVHFGNVYIEDERHIPEDELRKIIYRSRTGFRDYMANLGFERPLKYKDFFVRGERSPKIK
jgi:trans-aconitate methyltransferase